MTTLVTPVGPLSYPKLFRSELPKDPKPEDNKAWSTAILFDKAAVSSPQFKAMWDEAIRMAGERFGSDASGKIEFDAKGESYMLCGKDTLKMPFRKNSRGTYDDKYLMFVNVRKVDKEGVRAPQIIDQRRNPILDSEAIYPGVLARIAVSCFSWATKKGAKGVSFGLNNVQKAGEGARLDNFKSASDEFDELPEDKAAAGGALDPALEALLG